MKLYDHFYSPEHDGFLEDGSIKQIHNTDSGIMYNGITYNVSRYNV